MNKFILLIDDDVDERYILEEALQDSNVEAQCAHAENVGEALKFLSKAVPDYIFLDINMPGTNGFEVLALIKQMDVMKDVPVIVYSTAVTNEVVKKALSLGAIGALKKTNSILSLAQSLTLLFERTFFASCKY